jgi:hypothetical protein
LPFGAKNGAQFDPPRPFVTCRMLLPSRFMT